MIRQLFLLRHAEAAHAKPNEPDEIRMLTGAGEQSAKQVGEFLQNRNSNLNLILSSPAVRAYQTSLLLAKQVTPIPDIKIEHNIYNGSIQTILKLIAATPDTIYNLLVVGHYPTIVDLQNHLAPSHSISSMSPAELISLHFETSWSELSSGIATFNHSFHPSHS